MSILDCYDESIIILMKSLTNFLLGELNHVPNLQA